MKSLRRILQRASCRGESLAFQLRFSLTSIHNHVLLIHNSTTTINFPHLFLHTCKGSPHDDHTLSDSHSHSDSLKAHTKKQVQTKNENPGQLQTVYIRTKRQHIHWLQDNHDAKALLILHPIIESSNQVEDKSRQIWKELGKIPAFPLRLLDAIFSQAIKLNAHPLVIALWNTGDPLNNGRVSQHMHDSTVIAKNVVTAFVESNRFDEARSLILNILSNSSQQINSSVCLPLLKAWIDLAKYSDVLTLWRQIKDATANRNIYEKWDLNNVYPYIIKAALTEKDWKTFKIIENDLLATHQVPHEKNINLLMSAFVKLEKPQKAIAFFDQYIAHLKNLSNFIRYHGDPLNNIQLIATLLTAAYAIPNSHRTLAIFDHICKTEIRPEPHLLSTIIKTCLKSSRFSEAIQVLERALLLNFDVNIHNFRLGFNACKNLPDPDKATSLLTEMLALGIIPDVVCYNHVISSLEKTLNWEDILAVLDQMDENMVEPNTSTFSIAISACTKAREWNIVAELFNQMSVRGVNGNAQTYGHVLVAAERISNWDLVANIFDTVFCVTSNPATLPKNKYQADSQICEIAVLAFKNTNNWSRIFEIYTSMEQAGLDVTGKSYQAILFACYKLRKTHLAFYLLMEMHSSDISPDSSVLSSVMEQCTLSGMGDKCMLLYEMRKNSGLLMTMEMFNAALGACDRHEQEEKAIEILDYMRAYNVSPNEESYARAIGSCRIRKNQLSLVSEQAEDIADEKKNSTHRKNLIALKLLESMTAEGLIDNTTCYLRALESCADCCDWKACLQLFQDMLKSGVTPDEQCFLTVIKCCAPHAPETMEQLLGIMDQLGIEKSEQFDRQLLKNQTRD